VAPIRTHLGREKGPEMLARGSVLEKREERLVFLGYEIEQSKSYVRYTSPAALGGITSGLKSACPQLGRSEKHQSVP
jgi:hypothetical protein